MNLDDLIARESIRDLVARYNANGDTGRFAQVFELFADDAVMELRNYDGSIEVYDGLERVQTIFTGTKEKVNAQAASSGPAYLRHNTSTHQIDLIDADHAKGRAYFFVIVDHGLDHWGRYVDDYVRIDGTWKFAKRTVIMDGRVPHSWF